MKIKTSTIVRTAVLVLALVNQCLSIAGKAILPISDEQLEQFISLSCTIAAAVWAWWKNNSYTEAAIEGDIVKDRLKKAGK